MVARSRLIAHLQAELLTDMVAVAEVPPDAVPEICEDFYADEVSAALVWTRRAAQTHVDLGRDLVGRLPAVHAALAAGLIDLPRARVFSDVLELVDDAGLAARLADKVLPKAPGLTTSQIRARLRYRLLAADPAAAKKRYDRALAGRDATIWASDDGTAGLHATFLAPPPARARAAFQRVEAIARGARQAGDPRTLAQLRADTMLDLLDGTIPYGAPVERRGVIELTIPWATLAAGGDAPGELAGFGPVLADVARQAVAMYDESQWRFSVRGQHNELLFHGITRARPTPPALASPPDTRPATEQGAAGPPPVPCPPTDNPAARFPNAPLRRWIATRDHTCRFPTCNAPARCCDLDHSTDHAHGGPTHHGNLALLCRHHHRLKHEGGWRTVQNPDGTITWIAPSGRHYRRSHDRDETEEGDGSRP